MDIIQDMSLDDGVLERLGTSRAYIHAKGWAPATWMHLATYLAYGDADLAVAAMPEVLKRHAVLVARGTSHLALWIQNITRSSYLASSMLSPNAVTAQAAAIEFERHVLTIAPGRRNSFERAFVENERLMANLADFAHAAVPICVWQGKGAYKRLFVFLALRFLLNREHVLDCERGHARWQWLNSGKRNLRLNSMNAHLRMLQYLETYQNEFPPRIELAEYIDAETTALNNIYALQDREGLIAPRYRSDFHTWNDSTYARKTFT